MLAIRVQNEFETDVIDAAQLIHIIGNAYSS